MAVCRGRALDTSNNSYKLTAAGPVWPAHLFYNVCLNRD